LSRILQGLGIILGTLGVIFVGFKLREYSSQIGFSELGFQGWLALAGLGSVCGLSGLLLALAWRDLLNYFGVSVSRRWAVWAYGVSQLARYIPGNIFHLASRQAIGAGAGIAQWPLAKSTVWELGLIAAIGGLFACLALLFPDLSLWHALMALTAVVLCATFLALRVGGPRLARVVLSYALFLSVSGTVFSCVLSLTAPAESVNAMSLWRFVGAYIVAWLVGLATPGAPAGVGVREVVLYSLLKPFVSDSDLLTAIVLGRMVTVAGDLAYYVVALGMSRRSKLPYLEI
jgi:hypothetical protein